jgi:transcriptional regulator with XRE-family HTH domain
MHLKLPYMPPESLSQRLFSALQAAALSPAALAERIGTTEATISNWLNDKVQMEHVKAAVLLRISGSLGVRPEWLLFGEGSRQSEVPSQSAASQSVKHETLTLALQLAGEVLEEKGLSLPPNKRAEVISLIYDLLEEGMPEAKVLRFARAAAA